MSAQVSVRQGNSPSLYLRSLSARAGAFVILRSAPLDPKLSEKGILLGIVPRGAGEQPTAMIAARKGAMDVLFVRDKTNKWQTIVVPGVSASVRITAFASMRVGRTTYIVAQLTNPAKVTSYKAVLVPGAYL
jgi:hypothetical protein